MVQCIGVHLPRQETQVQSLVQEDPTCRGATKPTCHNYWVCALEPTRLEPVLRNKRSHCDESVHCNQEEPLLTATRESLHTATKTPRSQVNESSEKD